MRLSGVFSIMLAVLCGSLLFWTSQSVQKFESEVFRESARVSSEIESYRILTAEWDYLNRPERLEYLTTRGLDIDADFIRQDKILINTDDIPEPLMPAIPQVKPSPPLLFVSSETPSKISKSAPLVVRNNDSKTFNRLLTDVVKAGAE